MPLRNKVLCCWRSETWWEERSGSIAEYYARATFLDFSESTSLEDAQRRAALAVDRMERPTETVEAEVIVSDDLQPVPSGAIWPGRVLSVPTRADVADDFDDQVVIDVQLRGGLGGQAVEVSPTLNDRRVIAAQLQQLVLERATRGSGGASNVVARSGLAVDDFPELRTGRVEPITGPSFSRPDDVLVGISPPWKPPQRMRLTALRLSTSLSGVDYTRADIVLNDTPLSDVWIRVEAGYTDAQTIVYDLVVVPTDRVQVRVTHAGGHTSVNIQVTGAPAI